MTASTTDAAIADVGPRRSRPARTMVIGGVLLALGGLLLLASYVGPNVLDDRQFASTVEGIRNGPALTTAGSVDADLDQDLHALWTPEGRRLDPSAITVTGPEGRVAVYQDPWQGYLHIEKDGVTLRPDVTFAVTRPGRYTVAVTRGDGRAEPVPVIVGPADFVDEGPDAFVWLFVALFAASFVPMMVGAVLVLAGGLLWWGERTAARAAVTPAGSVAALPPPDRPGPVLTGPGLTGPGLTGAGLPGPRPPEPDPTTAARARRRLAASAAAFVLLAVAASATCVWAFVAGSSTPASEACTSTGPTVLSGVLWVLGPVVFVVAGVLAAAAGRGLPRRPVVAWWVGWVVAGAVTVTALSLTDVVLVMVGMGCSL